MKKRIIITINLYKLNKYEYLARESIWKKILEKVEPVYLTEGDRE
jgi:hypothetical protein